jgi:hypothetical protein
MKAIKEKLSKLYLESAGKLPRFQGGLISNLQSMRDRQIEDANKCLENTKKPDGNDLVFHSLNLYEAYFLEDFNRLKKDFDGIYTKSSKRSFNTERYVNQYNDFIDKALKDFLSGGWSNLGIIISEENSHNYLGGIRLQRFPEEIELIQIALFHALPSVIVVQFNIRFKEKIIRKLDALINSKCYGKIVFSTLFPFKWCGHKETFADNEKTKIICDYFTNLRKISEEFIKKYFKGHFLSDSQKIAGPICPAIEIFSISDFPNSEEEIDKKVKTERGFWNTLGFQWYYKFDIFNTEKLFFFNRAHSLSDLEYPFRVLIKKKNLRIDIYGDVENAINCETADFLHGYTHPIILSELFKKILNQVNIFRISIGKGIFSKSFFNPKLSKLLQLDQGVTQERFVFNRLSSEYRYMKSLNYLARNAETAAGLKDSKLPHFKSQDLLEALFQEMERYLSLIKDQYETLNTGFKDYLDVKNLQVSYKLQRRIFWLTVFLLLIAIIQMLPEKKKENMFLKISAIYKYVYSINEKPKP